MGVRLTFEAGRQTAVYLLESFHLTSHLSRRFLHLIRKTRLGGNTSLTGKAKAVNAGMVKEGAVVIDAGVNRIGMSKEGKAILCGDVDFGAVKEKTGMIRPMPGGVGSMTIPLLMTNTVKAAKTAAGIR